MRAGARQARLWPRGPLGSVAVGRAKQGGPYRIGLNFLRRRKSGFIHGAEDDAREIVEHLTRYLATA